MTINTGIVNSKIDSLYNFIGNNYLDINDNSARVIADFIGG